MSEPVVIPCSDGTVQAARNVLWLFCQRVRDEYSSEADVDNTLRKVSLRQFTVDAVSCFFKGFGQPLTTAENLKALVVADELQVI